MLGQYKVPDMSVFVPVPFPNDIPTIHLEKISLAKLISNDEDESKKMFDICTSCGFFNLDLADHPDGRTLLEDAVAACRLSRELFKLPLEEKRKYEPPKVRGVFDRGYFARDGVAGEPRYNEIINIPTHETFNPSATAWKFPDWLTPHTETFKRAMRSGNTIANHIFTILERRLSLPPGTITSIHQLSDPSSDFLRMLRYPGLKPGIVDQLTFPAHRDSISLAILFTWLGGLQIPAPSAEYLDPMTIREEHWRWVPPEPGCAIVNLGDAMALLTDGALKSGLHRVVRAPGAQAGVDRYSVLIGTRPRNDFPMVPFGRTVGKEEAPTSKEWGNTRIVGLGNWIENRERNKEVLVFSNSN